MFTRSIEDIQRAVLQDIINELNVKQGVPVSFDRVTLTPDPDEGFQGVIGCSEAGGHLWELQLQVSVDGEEVTWKLDGEPQPHRFHWQSNP